MCYVKYRVGNQPVGNHFFDAKIAPLKINNAYAAVPTDKSDGGQEY